MITCYRCGQEADRHHLALFCHSCCVIREKDPFIVGARQAVSKAVAQGLMPPARHCTCVDCGKPARDYDHRDYSKPLEVDPVCRSCNVRRGPAIGSLALRKQIVAERRAARSLTTTTTP